MGWFSKILVQKTNTGELVDITDLDQEHYESFLTAMEQLRIAYKVAIERKQKDSTSQCNCIKPEVSDAVCHFTPCLDQYNRKCMNGSIWKTCHNRQTER